jgi:hypothetical protein
MAGKYSSPFSSSAILLPGSGTGICEGERGTEELRIAYRKSVIEPVLEHLAPDEEKAENHHDSDEREHQRHPFADGDVPPLATWDAG